MTRHALVTTLALLVASPVFAQGAPSRGWVDFNVISLQSQQEVQNYTLTSILFDETASAALAYPSLPSARGGELSGGMHLGRNVGVGIHVGLVSYEYPVGLALNIPHPLYFDRFASDADTTEGTLARRDRSLNFMATYVLPTQGEWSIRVFGGPSYFKVEQDMVEDIAFEQFFDLAGANVVDITASTQRTVNDSAWGFNVGVDAAYFFSRHVGIGGVARFNRATVTVEEPLTAEQAELKAGALAVGAGVRFRF